MNFKNWIVHDSNMYILVNKNIHFITQRNNKSISYRCVKKKTLEFLCIKIIEMFKN